jgi:hypothetical protein
MQLFVKKNTRVEVNVYAWEDEQGNVDATHDRATIPEKVAEDSVETVTFFFRRPSYLDSTAILRQANLRGEGEIDFAEFQDLVLRTLLVDWNLKDEQGQTVSARGQAVSNLQPAVARAAVAGCLEKINLF